MLISGIQDQVLSRAARSPKFRQELMDSPHAVLQREYNLSIPADVIINIVEDTVKSLTIGLPAPVKPQPTAVKDGDLQAADPSEIPQIKILWTGICSSDGPCS